MDAKVVCKGRVDIGAGGGWRRDGVRPSREAKPHGHYAAISGPSSAGPNVNKQRPGRVSCSLCESF